MSELEAPADAPPPEPVAPDPEPEASVAPSATDEPITDDAALNADIESKAIKIPDGEELVPRSLLTNVAISYRNKLKEAKQGSPEAVALKQQLDQAQAQLREAEPLAQAFRAIQSAPQQPQQQVQQPPAEDVAKLQRIAKSLDFYNADASFNLDKAREHLALVREEAQSIAQQQTAPLVMHTLSGQAQQNIQLAKNTKHPVTGKPADPAIIDRLVSQLQQQDGGLATLANRETMKHVWLNAYSLSTLSPDFAKEAPVPVAQQQAPTPALVTERSGGAVANQPRGLSASEKKAAKEAGLTEKAYLDVAAGMKW